MLRQLQTLSIRIVFSFIRFATKIFHLHLFYRCRIASGSVIDCHMLSRA